MFYEYFTSRVEHEQKYRATEAGLEYAIFQCIKNFDSILTEGNNFSAKEIETGEFKISENTFYKCKISIERDFTSKDFIKLDFRAILIFLPNLSGLTNFDSKDSLNGQNGLNSEVGQKVFEITCSMINFYTDKDPGKDSGKDSNKNKKRRFIIKNWKQV